MEKKKKIKKISDSGMGIPFIWTEQQALKEVIYSNKQTNKQHPPQHARRHLSPNPPPTFSNF